MHLQPHKPRLLIGAVHKSSGKTTLTLGLCAALRRRGLSVQPYKKGPDYIDPMWLSQATGQPCFNLDFQTQGHDELLATLHRYTADISIIEGNMGLFDSIDIEGRCSNAALAALLQTPVILVINALGMTRSVIPIVRGYQTFDPSIRIAGIILNNVAGKRHEERLREVFARYIDIPLLGCVLRNPQLAISERHLGLIPSNELDEVEEKLAFIANMIGQQLDLEKILEIARTAPALPAARLAGTPAEPPPAAGRVRIGIARDAAFGFYYPDDLERLQAAGAELVPFDTLNDPALPAVDALFIGGGFPEAHMAALEANQSMRASIREAIEGGLPAYAECGGLMYLARSIRWGEKTAAMVGLIPGDAVMHERPQWRGYARLQETANHPWLQGDPAEFDAHEFHYSTLENLDDALPYAYTVLRGAGINAAHDGIVYKNLLANYAHLRDVGTHHWTRRFVEFIRRLQAKTNPTSMANTH